MARPQIPPVITYVEVFLDTEHQIVPDAFTGMQIQSTA